MVSTPSTVRVSMFDLKLSITALPLRSRSTVSDRHLPHAGFDLRVQVQYSQGPRTPNEHRLLLPVRIARYSPIHCQQWRYGPWGSHSGLARHFGGD
jgi:hypothetical protein